MPPFFIEKNAEPTREMLSHALGKSMEILDSMTEFIAKEFEECHTEWKFYGTKLGWSLKIFNKKRNVVFVAPENNYFRVAFAYGQRAFEEIMKSNLPDSLKTDISMAKVYAEGRPLRLEISEKSDLNILFQLIRLKINN